MAWYYWLLIGLIAVWMIYGLPAIRYACNCMSEKQMISLFGDRGDYNYWLIEARKLHGVGPSFWNHRRSFHAERAQHYREAVESFLSAFPFRKEVNF